MINFERQRILSIYIIILINPSNQYTEIRDEVKEKNLRRNSSPVMHAKRGRGQDRDSYQFVPLVVVDGG